MSTVTQWNNNRFGKKGFFYPLLYLLPTPLLLYLIMFLNVLIFYEADLLTNMVMLFVSLGVVYLIIRMCESISFASSLIKQVNYDGDGFIAKSFGGRKFRLDRHVTFFRDDDFFSKETVKFLFPKSNNFVLRVNDKEYYLSGAMDNADELIGHLVENCTVGSDRITQE